MQNISGYVDAPLSLWTFNAARLWAETKRQIQLHASTPFTAVFLTVALNPNSIFI
ncbi:hypothetical protein GP644_15815 [Parasedimentitalea maritima]|uniref:Uncharacterized protein n=1 Tax=Parasedimentitalea maritima TaxID=2578117 RepID=A0A6A4R8Y5_9RHOB|nr:hypothetical protein GP644_15815 [Zongyanglinia marina]